MRTHLGYDHAISVHLYGSRGDTQGLGETRHLDASVLQIENSGPVAGYAIREIVFQRARDLPATEILDERNRRAAQDIARTGLQLGDAERFTAYFHMQRVVR